MKYKTLLLILLLLPRVWGFGQLIIGPEAKFNKTARSLVVKTLKIEDNQIDSLAKYNLVYINCQAVVKNSETYYLIRFYSSKDTEYIFSLYEKPERKHIGNGGFYKLKREINKPYFIKGFDTCHQFEKKKISRFFRKDPYGSLIAFLLFENRMIFSSKHFKKLIKVHLSDSKKTVMIKKHKERTVYNPRLR